MNTHLPLIKSAVCAALLSLCGTSLAGASEPWQKGVAPVDSTWQYTEFLTQPVPDADRWWTLFSDDTLSRFIALAMRNNYDAKAALHRIKAAEAQMQSLYSGYYPVIGVSAGYENSRESGIDDKPYGKGMVSSFFTLGLSAQWEIDIFGRIAAKVKAGKASLGVSRLEYDALLVSLAANVAKQYYSLLMYIHQLHNAESQIASQTEIKDIVEARFKAGLVSALDVAQAKSVLYNTKAQLPDLKVNTVVSRNALATLCGITADDVNDLLGVHPMIYDAPPVRAAGLPADLLRRRPDIVEAELNLARLSAQVGIAKKDFLPTLSLQASVGVNAHDLGKLFTHNALDYSVSPTLSWTVFDGLARNKAVVEARQGLEAAVEDYNMTVTQAVADVNNAMASCIAADSRLLLMKDLVDAYDTTMRLSLERYKLGLIDFTDVANAQQNLLSGNNSLISAKYQSLAAVVSLYEALGGGWDPADPYSNPSSSK